MASWLPHTRIPGELNLSLLTEKQRGAESLLIGLYVRDLF